MALRSVLVGAIAQSSTKKGLASALDSALTKQSTANSSAKGKQKQSLTKKAIGC